MENIYDKRTIGSDMVLDSEWTFGQAHFQKS